MDTYQTLAQPAIGEFRDRGSKFIAYAYNVYTDEQIKNHIARLWKEHPKACHICYAYRLGLDKNNFRANDDGEPSGTAGKPILGQIDSFQVTHVLVAVVRYFGGTLLGTSGLIQAYRAATQEALSQAHIITKTVNIWYRIETDYLGVNALMPLFKRADAHIVEQQYTDDKATFVVEIRKANATALQTAIADIDNTTISQLPTT